MPSRDRTRTQAGPLGTFAYKGPASQNSRVSNVTSYRGRCKDTVPSRNQPFTVTHQSAHGCAITWHQPLNVPDTQYKDLKQFTPDFFGNAGGNITHLSIPDEPSLTSLGPMLAARINPSRPVVDLPVSLFELKDLPDLVYTAGRSLIKNAASTNLKWEFGLKPLVSDVKKLLDFQHHIEKRVTVLQKLRQGSMIRKAQLWNGSEQSRPLTLFTTNSVPSHCFCRHTLDVINTSTKIWGYGRLVPSIDYRREMASDSLLRSKARQIVLGLTVDTATLWEALPWSWLVDWYSNVGDFLVSKRNLVDVEIRDLRICKTSKTEYYYSLDSSNFGMFKGQHSCSVTLISKERQIVSASLPSAQLPLLSGRQLGILASLSVLRRR